MRPFTMLKWEDVKQVIAILTFANIAARVANDCTGPTCKYVYYIRRCRERDQHDQHKGLQCDAKLEYIMYTHEQTQNLWCSCRTRKVLPGIPEPNKQQPPSECANV